MAQKRKWQPREQRMLSEYMAEAFPGVPYKVRIRLGAVQPRIGGKFTADESSMLGVFRRWADAMAFLPEKALLLIEAKIRPEPGVISQIELYEMLIPNTPELEQYRDWPIRKRIVYSIPDPATFSLARAKGIEIVSYRPEWIEEYMKTLQRREASPKQFSP